MSTTIRLDDELQRRVDRARGDVPRERFARTLISEALTQREVGGAPPGSRSERPEIAEGRRSSEAQLAGRASSSRARAGVTPRPKGKR